MPREAKPIKLSKKERAELNALTRKRNLAQGFVRRVRIVLLADEGFDNLEIAARLALHRNSIGKWRSRYLCDGIAGLDDKPRPGQPLKYSPSRIQKVGGFKMLRNNSGTLQCQALKGFLFGRNPPTPCGSRALAGKGSRNSLTPCLLESMR